MEQTGPPQPDPGNARRRRPVDDPTAEPAPVPRPQPPANAAAPGQGAPPAQRPEPAAGAPVPFSAPPAALPKWAIAAVLVLAVLVCAGFQVFNLRDAWHRIGVNLSAAHSAVATREPEPAGSAAPAASAPPAKGPSSHAVRTDDDLALVCDGAFYPKSPKFAGKAPHQISVGVVDQLVRPHRHMLAAVTVPDLRESAWRAWIPEKPAKSQLVACVDLVRAGKKIRSCSYDDPKMKVDLDQGFYRLRLFEAATGKKLLEKSVTGSASGCPSVVFLLGGQALFSEVSDSQLYGALKGYVMRK